MATTDKRSGKQRIKDALLHHLYHPAALQLERKTEALAIRNALAGGFSHKSFVYKAEVYNADVTPPPKIRIRLLSEYWTEMEGILQDMRDVMDEQPLIVAGLNRILNSCHDARDVLLILPDSLHHAVKDHQYALVSDKRLTSDKIEAIRAANAHSLDRMFERMALNLIL